MSLPAKNEPGTSEVQAAREPGERFRVIAICLGLAALTLAVFGRTLGHEFVNYDDGLYVNEQIAGLTWGGIGRTFPSGSADNWDPITTLSHMVDCRLFGLKPAGHHLTNVLLHAATAILLFLAWRRMTGLRPGAGRASSLPAQTLWAGAVVAAVFAVHPLRVESVAWVAERKDVLSGLFFMLTLGAYASYVSGSRCQVSGERQGTNIQHPTPNIQHPMPGAADRGPQSAIWYGCALVCFALGLLSKPMLVTLPFVLLLLDYWPLGRMGEHSTFNIQHSTSKEGPGSGDCPVTHHAPRTTPPTLGFKAWRSIMAPLFLEKLPFVALSLAFGIVTLFVQLPSMSRVEAIPFSIRLGNALVSYVIYLWQMIWPADLAVFYPYPKGGWALWQVVLSALLLAAISAGAFAWRRKQPWLLVGWLWYLGMLVPVIGLVQVGFQARADRYTYLPQIGLYLALAWTVISLSRSQVSSPRLRRKQMMLGGSALVVIATLSVVSFIQAGHWRDSEALWSHTLTGTTGNATAHNNLGAVFIEQGRLEEAAAQCRKALVLRPDAPGHNNLGAALLHLGRVDEAIVQFREATALDPAYAEAHDNLGIALSQIGQVDEAVRELQRALEIRPGHAESHYNLGAVLSQSGHADEAITHFEKALAAEPADAAAHANLGQALVRRGQAREAAAHFEKSLQFQPDNADTCKNFAWLLATSPDASVRNGPKAVALAAKAVRLSGGTDPALFGPLAAAYAEAGQFPDAVKTAQEALKLAVTLNNEPLADIIRKRIAQFQAGIPVRDPGQTNSPSASEPRSR